MAQAFADPDELDRFSHQLAQFVETVHEAVNGLNRSFGSLEESWQDEQRARFEEQYSTLLHQFSAFESDAREQIPYIQSLASSLREYLRK